MNKSATGPDRSQMQATQGFATTVAEVFGKEQAIAKEREVGRGKTEPGD